MTLYFITPGSTASRPDVGGFRLSFCVQSHQPRWLCHLLFLCKTSFHRDQKAEIRNCCLCCLWGHMIFTSTISDVLNSSWGLRIKDPVFLWPTQHYIKNTKFGFRVWLQSPGTCYCSQSTWVISWWKLTYIHHLRTVGVGGGQQVLDSLILCTSSTSKPWRCGWPWAMNTATCQPLGMLSFLDWESRVS